ncbi:hypothetical protein C8034_v001756 [Colletotrichum sidae]|uniref:Collagen-like protein mcl1 n=1 Tax=Colletotrichum sidae TaxID=1347389 RepID=A0A4R8TPK6_9PEZI|nr:hypothetical protein C8034_v001756 [Colletotrichum sidae]
MRQTALLSGITALLPSAALAFSTPHNLLGSRQKSNDPPPDAVCRPDVSGGQLPPCVQVENIEIACAPNGTESIYLEAHAQCMCGGSFFAEKLGCERCLRSHGLRSERDFAFYSGILASASNALCSGTPTAAFATVYSNIEAAATPVTTGATARSTVTNTAISVYYTPSGPQGPGSITGAAASATNTGAQTTAEPTENSTAITTRTVTSSGAASHSPSSASSGAASGDAATTATSDSGAVPTFAVGGLIAGAAGLAVLAGL